MKIKASQIAKELGLSKATVSLALNNKPGVSEETKKRIHDYIDSIENGNVEVVETKIIKLLNIKVPYEENSSILDWDYSFKQLNYEAKMSGFMISVDTVYIEELDDVIESYDDDLIAGILVFANNMKIEHFEKIKSINKPMIIYDNDFNDDSYSYVLLDGFRGLEKIIHYYKQEDVKHIIYLSNTGECFNFKQRREAFKYLCDRENISGEIIECGIQPNDICNTFKEYYMKCHPRYVICENYQVSIGVIKAIHELGLEFKKDISLIGIDELPDYFCFGYKLSMLRISHNQRAFMAITLLKQEIKNSHMDKFRIFSTSDLVIQETA